MESRSHAAQPGGARLPAAAELVFSDPCQQGLDTRIFIVLRSQTAQPGGARQAAEAEIKRRIRNRMAVM